VAETIVLKEAAVVVLQNDDGAALASGAAAAAAANLDNRSAGNAAENFWGNFELKAGFAPADGIVGKTVDLYLVPALDGTNFADVDTTTPTAPPTCYAGSFVIALSQTAAQRLPLVGVPLQPLLYKAYLFNNSGQPMSAQWGLRVVTASERYQ